MHDEYSGTEGIEVEEVVPRVTEADVDHRILVAEYHYFYGTTVVVCLLHMANGYAVVGHSACVSMDTFNEGVGRALAYDDARRQVWALEGYLLRERMHTEQITTPG